MAFRSVPFTVSLAAPTALAAALLASPAATLAQADAGPVQGVQTVTVSGRTAAPASIAGFGDVPLAKAPFSATVINAGALQDAGIDRHVRGWEKASDHVPVWIDLDLG